MCPLLSALVSRIQPAAIRLLRDMHFQAISLSTSMETCTHWMSKIHGCAKYHLPPWYLLLPEVELMASLMGERILPNLEKSVLVLILTSKEISMYWIGKTGASVRSVIQAR